MDKTDSIIIVGAGVFGLSTAYQLASEGYKNITVLDRHMPPVCRLHIQIDLDIDQLISRFQMDPASTSPG